MKNCIIYDVEIIALKRSLLLFWRGLNHLFWPAVCANCAENISDGDKGLCQKCWQQLLSGSGGDYCHRCGRDASKYGQVNQMCPDCQGKQFHFDGIARAGIYTSALRKMILAFKSGRTEHDSMLNFLAGAALEGSDFSEKIDFFVPVPLHFSRRLTRGYNQSHIIAGHLKRPGVKVNTDLVRLRRTKMQSAAVSAAGRAKNVAGAFAVRLGHEFSGKNICLIDDIKTSGATLNECAKTLKAAGAHKVFALVLAVAGQ